MASSSKNEERKHLAEGRTSLVSYFPAGGWQQNNIKDHYNSTYHFTNQPSAYLTFRFNGSFVAYCSDANYDHGQFSVSIDGRLLGMWSSYSPKHLNAMVLFSATVDPGTHVLRIDNTAGPTVIGLDYFMRWQHGLVEREHIVDFLRVSTDASWHCKRFAHPAACGSWERDP
ncbi:hypothetical protein AURDEDRAFT_184261 [Auricularia subglabra TFB-10046 SS5]|nr:hypothetical protein AURDEDRAFT_184261 [Auricularia subglabra TFB-10046 SS5]